jgi:hypothetical protein
VLAESNTSAELFMAPVVSFKLSAQPLSWIYVSTGLSATMGKDNLGYYPGADYFLSVDLFPLRFTDFGLTISGVNDNFKLTPKFGIMGKHYEAILEIPVYGLGDSFAGIEVKMSTAWHFASKSD